MLEIYTDASVSAKHCLATATCFVTDKTSFIGFEIFNYNPCNSTLLAEVQGATDGIEYAASVADMSQPVTLLSDFPAMYSLSKKDLTEATDIDKAVLAAVQKLQELTQKYKIRIEYIEGHQKSVNPNKLVDFMSNSALRYAIRGV